MSKTYSSAPLPFMGQKRRFAAEFTQALKTFDNITTVVDLFGGSGLLSHLAKRTRPDLRVVYNDFDNYSRRLANVERTNALLNEIRDIVTDVPRDKRLPTETKDKVLRAMKPKTADSSIISPCRRQCCFRVSMRQISSRCRNKRCTMSLGRQDMFATDILTGWKSCGKITESYSPSMQDAKMLFFCLIRRIYRRKREVTNVTGNSPIISTC